MFHSWMIPAALSLALLITWYCIVRNDKKIQPQNDVVDGLFSFIDGMAGMILGLIFIAADLIVWLVYFAVMYFIK